MADEWDALPDAKPKDEWDTLPDASAPAGQEDTAELPKPFLQRLQFGDAVRKLTNTLAKAPEVPEYEASPAAEKLLGLNGHTRFQTWPERMIRSGFTIAKDVIDGNVITGPGLRREDLLAIQGLPDDDTIPEPLDTLIERAGDMANFQLAGTVIPKGGPLFRTPDGKVARTVPDGESGIRGEVIGSPPKAADFDNAAKVIGEGEKFNAITITPTRDRLKTLWEEDGIHPSEAAAIADKDPFFKHDLTAKAEEAVVEFEGEKHPVGAAVNDLPPDISPSTYPTAPSSRWAAGASAAVEKALDLTTSLRDMVAPMAGGTDATRAIAKDFAVTLRRNRWDWSRIDTEIEKNFSPEARERIWNAMDEESVMQQRGEKSEHMGLATLEPRERELVDMLVQRSHDAWVRAYDAGLVRSEEGLPVYTPRMVINTAGVGAEGVRVSLDGMGKNLRVATKQMMKREHLTAEETEAAAREAFGPQAKIARDVRALPLATAKLEDAIAGRKMIDAIKEYGNTTGTDAVAVGFQPDRTWFTMDHPAFQEFKQRIGVKDEAGNPIYDKVPIYVHPDFEMPLRAVLDKKSGKLYQGLMDLKGRTMGLIMNSPAIHNFVEYGRAFPAIAMSEGTNGMGILTLKVYRDGFRAKHNVEVMHEAIEHGLDPIGKRFAFKQSIDGIMEEPSLTPGRSLTAQIASVVPDLFNPKAGDAVRRAIDKAGDFWHNTLLWDRIADLQMGLYVNLRDDLIRKGADRSTASYMAAHMANRYAGALPKEAMSNEATKLANIMLFSRQFTIGNLGVFKDAVTGLPKDIMAKIIEEGGTINPEAAGYAKALARRKAISTIALDVALLYAGNTIMQSAFNVMLGDRTLDQEFKGYIRRAKQLMGDVAENPAHLLQPLDMVEKLGATDENEPGRKEKIKIGYDKDGTAIYMRQPFGKIGEEFTGWANSPIEKAKNKLSTIAKPTLEIFNNDKGFGRKIYDPDASTPGAWAGNIWAIVSHFMKAQLPMGQINALSDLVKGDGDAKVNALQAFGPLFGFTFSKGAPGGPAAGELYAAKRRHDFQVDMALPDIRKQIQRGDLVGAYEKMNELQIPAGLQRYYVRTTLNPALRLRGRTLRDFYNQATPDQIRRFEEQRRGWNGAADE